MTRRLQAAQSKPKAPETDRCWTIDPGGLRLNVSLPGNFLHARRPGGAMQWVAHTRPSIGKNHQIPRLFHCAGRNLSRSQLAGLPRVAGRWPGHRHPSCAGPTHLVVDDHARHGRSPTSPLQKIEQRPSSRAGRPALMSPMSAVVA